MLENPYLDQCAFRVEKVSDSTKGAHPLEIRLSANFSSPARIREFLSGRRCAHAALSSLGYPMFAILRQKDRSPAWPFNIIGDISHSSELACAIIARPHLGIRGLGVDLLSLSRKINPGVIPKILSEQERDLWLPGKDPFPLNAKIAFSAKEAIFKCFYPLNKIYLDFMDAEILFIKDGIFKAKILKNPFNQNESRPLEAQGKVQIEQDHILTALLWKDEPWTDIKGDGF